MKLVHDFRLIEPTDPGFRWGIRRRICRYCHVGEDHVEVDRCEVLVARMEGNTVGGPVLEAALDELQGDPLKTPYTRDGLRQFDHLSPEEALVAAWTVHGPDSQWHALAQAQLRDSMPLLHRAIQRIVEQVKQEANADL